MPGTNLTREEAATRAALVTLSSHDVGGITSRDVDLARRISGFAAELGASADTSGLTELEPGLDTGAAERLGAVYAALLGGESGPGGLVESTGRGDGRRAGQSRRRDRRDLG